MFNCTFNNIMASSKASLLIVPEITDNNKKLLNLK